MGTFELANIFFSDQTITLNAKKFGRLTSDASLSLEQFVSFFS